jgi:hypothetical protein
MLRATLKPRISSLADWRLRNGILDFIALIAIVEAYKISSMANCLLALPTLPSLAENVPLQVYTQTPGGLALECGRCPVRSSPLTLTLKDIMGETAISTEAATLHITFLQYMHVPNISRFRDMKSSR